MTTPCKNEEVLEIIETNLIPAVVPHLSENSHFLVSEQPRRSNSVIGGTDGTRSIQHYNRRNPHTSKNPEGLARLSVAEEIVIESNSSFLHCLNSSAKYLIRDVSLGQGEESLIFEATESSSFCSFGNLRNVVITDREDVPVGRVCFKEKSFLLKSLVLAVYSPPQSLIGTVEESPNCIMFSSEYVLGNQDGDHLFRISYGRGLRNSSFTISLFENIGKDQQPAQILEKTKSTIRLKFISKMSISNKLIFVGFCLGILDKGLHQQNTSPVDNLS